VIHIEFVEVSHGRYNGEEEAAKLKKNGNIEVIIKEGIIRYYEEKSRRSYCGNVKCCEPTTLVGRTQFLKRERDICILLSDR